MCGLGGGHWGRINGNRLTVIHGRHVNTNLKSYPGEASVEKGRRLPLCTSAKDLVPPPTPPSALGPRSEPETTIPPS